MADDKIGHRPTDYMEEYDHLALIACQEGGFTDKKLSLLFGCCVGTIYNWKKEHPTFLKSIRAGKDSYDSEIAEKNLLKRIHGYKHVETTCEPQIIAFEQCEVPVLDKNGSPVLYKKGENKGEPKTEKVNRPITKMIATKKVKKQVPPDVKAIEIWLYNRNPERWKRLKQVELTGKDGGPIVHDHVSIMGEILKEITGENDTKLLPNGNDGKS